MYLVVLILEFSICESWLHSVGAPSLARSRPGGRPCTRVYVTLGVIRIDEWSRAWCHRR